MIYDKRNMPLTVVLLTVTIFLSHVSHKAASQLVTDAYTAFNTTEETDVTTQEVLMDVTENETNFNTSNNCSEYEMGYVYGDDYTEFIYTGYSFERPVYGYIWEILVIFTFLVNIIVIAVLLRRKMRNATNWILAAIAISDSLTGLVTLPTYIMVYQSIDSHSDYNYSYDLTNQSYDLNQYHLDYSIDSYGVHNNDAYPPIGGPCVTNTDASNSTSSEYPDHYYTDPGISYVLSKSLCRGFMISKFFLMKSFHTVSIFLTLFLAIQRYVSVAFPFKSQSLFTVRKTIICCVVIFIVSPALHLFHLLKEHGVKGLCHWEVGNDGCGYDCMYLWILFIIRHFIPCFALTTFTILFIKNLQVGVTNLRRMDSNASQMSRRKEENRRISIIVTAIVVVFLVPEIPYGIFLLYSAIDLTFYNAEGIKTERNRVIHMVYELSLILSFHANFYIYTFLNKKFRNCLFRTCVKPVQKLVGNKGRLAFTSQTSSSFRGTRRSDFPSTEATIELKAMQTCTSEKSITMETKLQNSVSPDVSKSISISENHKTDTLNANV